MGTRDRANEQWRRSGFRASVQKETTCGEDEELVGVKHIQVGAVNGYVAAMNSLRTQ